MRIAIALLVVVVALVTVTMAQNRQQVLQVIGTPSLQIHSEMQTILAYGILAVVTLVSIGLMFPARVITTQSESTKAQDTKSVQSS